MNIPTKHHDLVRLYTISREREEGNFWKFWKANLKKNSNYPKFKKLSTENRPKFEVGKSIFHLSECGVQ